MVNFIIRTALCGKGSSLKKKKIIYLHRAFLKYHTASVLPSIQERRVTERKDLSTCPKVEAKVRFRA